MTKETEIQINIMGHGHMPKQQKPGDAGFDLCAAEGFDMWPGKTAIITTGIKIAVPEGWEAQIRPRSGLAAKHGIIVVNSPGTIDSGYRGEIKVILHMLITEKWVWDKYGDGDPECEHDVPFKKGDRIAQLVFKEVPKVRLVQVDELDETERDDGGLGSTGV